jgi:hypothetical protein
MGSNHGVTSRWSLRPMRIVLVALLTLAFRACSEMFEPLDASTYAAA